MSQTCLAVIFSNKAYNAIIDETFRKDPVETGGILLGHVFDNGIWVVMEVIPPGIDSIHQYAYFEYDEKFVNYLADSVATKYENKLELLGLWHRHPGSMDVFSGTDDGTNKVFASLRPSGAISGLVNVDPNFRLTMRHVSTPLHYEIVDVEVGDDLIPEEYFKLRHFPAKGLNPAPDVEKKNELMSIGSMSEQKSSSNNKKSIREQINSLDWKSLRLPVLGLLAIFFLSLFLMLQSSQWIVSDDTDMQVALFEILYRASDDEGIYLLKNTLIPVCIKPVTAVNIIKYSLLMISALLMGLTYIPHVRKKLITGSGIFALLILLILPVRLSMAFCILLILVMLACVVIGSSILQTRRKAKPVDAGPWYQTHKDVFAEEDRLIRAVEPNAERCFEGGKLLYMVITDRKVVGQDHPLAYQVVFSEDYIKSGAIRIYLIIPDIDDMLLDGNNLKSPYLKIDDMGEKYLDFKERDANLNGASQIECLYKWIEAYNRYGSDETGK